MDREKGFGYCGLACCLCGDKTCPGCRREGCPDNDGCKSYHCGRERGHDGCWDCHEFPCGGGILEKQRVRAFAAFLRDYGEEKLFDCLERNEKNGIVYHYLGGFVGDYDRPETEAGVVALILEGARPPRTF